MTGRTDPLVGRGRPTLDDRYDLVERIGAGGMAEVWRARDTRLDRDVAVKLLPSTGPQDAGRRRRIEREARALATVSHPNVVAVYDHGEAVAEDGRLVPYLVMELVEGPDLHRYLEERGPLPVDEARSLLGAILAGIAKAHEMGVVHGDLKPANVFVDPHGPKVGDFGVARILDEETGTTTVAATPTFAAPEVLKGERATRSSDVYSVACLAYQLLAGRPPFEGGNAWEIASKHLESPVPSLRRVRTDVPSEMAAAVAHAMDKDPGRRYADAAAFADALGAPASQPVDATTPLAREEGAATAEPTEALTAPRVDPAAVAVFGPAARWWSAFRGRLRSGPGRAWLVLLLIALAAFAVIAMRDPGPVLRPVPDVVGQTYQDAASALRLEGFRVDVSFRPIAEGEAGRVLKTIPGHEAEAAAGSEVHLIAGATTQTPAPAVQPAAAGGGNDEDEGRRARGKRRKND